MTQCPVLRLGYLGPRLEHLELRLGHLILRLGNLGPRLGHLELRLGNLRLRLGHQVKVNAPVEVMSMEALSTAP